MFSVSDFANVIPQLPAGARASADVAPLQPRAVGPGVPPPITNNPIASPAPRLFEMQVGDVPFLVERLGKDCHPLAVSA